MSVLSDHEKDIKKMIIAVMEKKIQ